MEDKQIISLYHARDERAIKETDVKYGRYCHRIAKNLLTLHEDAEECVSDTWLRAWNSIPPQKPNSLKLFLAKSEDSIDTNIGFSSLGSSQIETARVS